MLAKLMLLACLQFIVAPHPTADLSFGEDLLAQLGNGRSITGIQGTAKSSLKGPDAIVYALVKNLNTHAHDRDLARLARRHAWRALLPDPYEFMIKYAIDETKSGEKLQAALLPHEVLHTLFSHARDLFGCLMGEDDALSQWWAEAATVFPEWYSAHPVVQEGVPPEKRIPIGIHGDDAGVHGQEQVLVVTWGSLLSPKHTMDSRICFSMMRVRHILPDDTMQTIYGVLKWSFEAMATGKFPKTNHEGKEFVSKVTPELAHLECHHPLRASLAEKELAGCIRGCFAEMRGDWKYLKEALHLQQHYGLDGFICHRCKVLKFSGHDG